MLNTILQKRMKELDLNYAKLSKRVGISDVYVGKIVSGSRIPSARILRALSEALDLDYNALRIEAYKQRAPKGVNIVFDEDRDRREIRIRNFGIRNIPVLTPNLWENSRDVEHLLRGLDRLDTIEPAPSDDPQAFWLIVPEDERSKGLTGKRIAPGDYLLVEPNKDPENGNFVLTLGDDRVWTSIYYKTEKGKFYIPAEGNGNPPDYHQEEDPSKTHYPISRVLTKYN